MRKWTYLVAMLMLTCATTTFTGCIDTDEPAGIEELRGAKAELLRAKAKVEEAKIAQVNAEAKLKEAEAKAKEAEAQAALLRAEYEAAIAQQKAEAEIAKIQAEIAKIQAETNKYLTEAEIARQQAEAAHQRALIEIQQAMAGLVEKQAKAVADLNKAYEDALAEYNEKVKAYKAAVEDYNAAMTDLDITDNDELADKRNYELEIVKAERGLASAQATLDFYKEELVKAEAMTPSDLQTKYLELSAEVDALSDSLHLLKLEKAQVRYNNIAEYEKWDALEDSIEEASKFTMAAYKNETAKDNPTVSAKFNGVIRGFEDGVFSYEETDAQLNSDLEIAGNGKAIMDMVDMWLEELEGAKLSDNTIANDSLLIPGLKKDVATADTAHQKAVAAWEILVNAKKGNPTTATAAIDTLKKYTDMYNATFNQVAPAVAAVNAAIKAIDTKETALGVAASNAKFKELEDKKYEELYFQGVEDSLSGTDLTAWMNLNDKKSIKAFEALFGDSLAALVAADATDSLASFKKTDAYKKEGLVGSFAYQAKQAKDQAIAKDLIKGDNSEIGKAFATYKAAVELVDSLSGALAADSAMIFVNGKYEDFTDILEADYGQKVKTAIANANLGLSNTADACLKTVAKKDSIYPMLATSLTTSLPDGANLHYLQVNGSDISAAEFTTITTTELDDTFVAEAWADKSYAAWGAGDRMVALAEDEVIKVDDATTSLIDESENTFWAYLNAKAILAAAEAGLTINPIYDTLITEIKAQKAVLEAQIEAAQDAVEAQKVALNAQKEVIHALEKVVTDKIDAVTTEKGLVEELMLAYLSATINLGDQTSPMALAAVINDIKTKIVSAEDALFDAKTGLIQAKADLENWEAEDNTTLATKKLAMENAEFDLKNAEDKVARALAYLEAALAALQNVSAE